MKKRLISMLLLICMLFTMLPTQTIAAAVEGAKARETVLNATENTFIDVKESD